MRCCTKVTGFISLSLTLCLSTFHIGRAKECVSMGWYDPVNDKCCISQYIGCVESKCCGVTNVTCGGKEGEYVRPPAAPTNHP